MKRIQILLMLISLACFCGINVASAQSMYGALSNFDCFNDGGEDAHGFEIELDGLNSNDVTSFFGSPNTQYGNPTMVNFTGGVYVRYTSPWDAANNVFTITTPIAPTPITLTGGHSCWYGGAAGYPDLGCEHFGVTTGRNPTAVKYRWLLADPVTPGNLIARTPDVVVPGVTWTTTPPPVPGNPPIVAAEIEPPSPEAGFQFSDAYWVKTYVKESPTRVSLDHLVMDDPSVPQDPGEIESEWELFQTNPNLPRGGKLMHSGALGVGSMSIVRRYEFYKYTGSYDPESHEALCVDPNCNIPAPNELGDFVGAQMSASNFNHADQVTNVQLSKYNFVYNPGTKTYSGIIILKNTGATAIQGPVEVVFMGLPPTATMINPTGKFLRYPYILVPSLNAPGKNLAPGQSTNFKVSFNAKSAFKFSMNVYSGAF